MVAHSVVEALAMAFLAGPLELEALAGRGAKALGRSSEWLLRVAKRFVDEFGGAPRPRKRDAVQFLSVDRDLNRLGKRLRVAQWLTDAPGMQPVEAARGWPVPVIEGPLSLADWLEVDLEDLEWFADLKPYLRKPHVPAPLRHYHYRILGKGSGSVRVIEAPKERLKQLQRKILAGILDVIPAHPVVHGFRKGRSIQSFVDPHIGQRVVLKMDLTDFFPSIRRARVQALFRTMGYPEAVANILGGICTTITPREILRGNSLYCEPHLPQGAPTSPALANLCAYRVDCRLSGLARSAGASYTRYADDLAFSGDLEFERVVERFSLHVAAILIEEGFEVHHRKTRIMRQGVRQHLAGLVTNERANVRRSDFDLLKATLTNCIRHGPATQNREDHTNFRAHLDGRIGFVESINPEKARKLRALWNQIDWT